MRNVELLQNNGVDIESSLQLLGTMELYNETIKVFLEEVINRLNRIKSYKEANDMSSYAIEVHSLKSDSKYLGFTKLSELSYQHEMASKENNSSYVFQHFNELMMEAVRIVTLSRQYIGQNVGSVKATSLKKAIIVADDSIIIRNFVNKVFSSEYEILPAIDGNEVIRIVTENKDKDIEGLLLDLNMPNCNGFTVLEYFKQNNLFSKIPVSIITGDDTKDSIDKAFQYPIIDMLNKPFNESDVRKILEKTISFHQE